MSAKSASGFAAQLQQSGLLDATQLAEVSRLEASLASPAQLAGELVRRGWLTTYQANQIALSRAANLLLGSYIILEPLRSGGMGEVIKARHRYMQRDVALKLIRPDQRDGPELVQRFQRETRLLAEMRHPHIVQAFDAGQVGDVWFLAMELLQGCDLAQLVQQQGMLPVAQACDYIRQAALGLQYAHQRGLVHRDIKPSNLFLTSEGVKLLDLGLARTQSLDAATQSGDLTHANAVMGTPDFLSPEQALNPRRAGTRSDLYSLGCTLYFLLAGRPPFPVGTLTQKLLHHQQSTPTPIDSLRHDVHPVLTALLHCLMAKPPEQRPPNAAEVVNQLTPFAHAAPPTAIPVSTGTAVAVKDRGNSVFTAPTVMPGATSLVDSRAPAPESGWTLMSETPSATAHLPTAVLPPSPQAIFSEVTLPAHAEPPTGPTPWRAFLVRRRVPLAVGGGAVLLLILLLVFWPKSSSTSQTDRPGEPSPRLVEPPLRFLNMNCGIMAWLSFSKDGKTLSGTGEALYYWRTHLWDTRTGSKITEFDRTSCGEFSPDGNYLACGGTRAEVRLLHPTTHTLIQSVQVDKSLDPVRGVKFSADSKRMLCFGHGNPVVWEMEKRVPLRSFPRVDDYPERFYRASLCDLSPDGGLLATGTARAFQVMAVDRAGHIEEQFAVAEGVISTAFSRDGLYLAAGMRKGGVVVEKVLSSYGTPPVSKEQLLQLNIPMPRSMAFHPHSSLLVVGSDNGKLYLAAADRGWELTEVTAHNHPVTALRFSADGTRLASGDQNGTINLWELKR